MSLYLLKRVLRAIFQWLVTNQYLSVKRILTSLQRLSSLLRIRLWNHILRRFTFISYSFSLWWYLRLLVWNDYIIVPFKHVLSCGGLLMRNIFWLICYPWRGGRGAHMSRRWLLCIIYVLPKPLQLMNLF